MPLRADTPSIYETSCPNCTFPETLETAAAQRTLVAAQAFLNTRPGIRADGPLVNRLGGSSINVYCVRNGIQCGDSSICNF